MIEMCRVCDPFFDLSTYSLMKREHLLNFQDETPQLGRVNNE